jgi:uncharacterized RDD family membrane protein YckC
MDIKAPQNFSVVDGYSLASPFERILAFLIDLGIYSLIYAILFATFWVTKFSWLAGGLAVLYLIFRDSLSFLGYQSIGKKVMKLKVIDNHDGLKLTIKDAFKRNFIFIPNLLYAFGPSYIFMAGTLTIMLILIEVYLMYTSSDHQRLGDQFADTLVIENSI